MSAPVTPLLIAPPGESDLLGRSMPGADLVRGLRRINPAVYAHFQGPTHTGIWIGKPGAPGTRFVCAFHHGAVPEWTQLDPHGQIIVKGWRAVFEKVITSRAATRTAIERTFRIDLAPGPRSNLCLWCVREGVRGTHNGGKHRLCDTHEQVYASAQRDKAEAPERAAAASHVRQREYNV